MMCACPCSVFRQSVRSAATRAVVAAGLMLAMAACTPLEPSVQAPAEPPGPPPCQPAAPDDALVGNWLGVRTQKGVAGELRTLFTLQADGSMTYTEQLKRKGKPSQGLSESGCWHRDDNTLILQTQESNGYPVDLDDPIYTNRYAVVSQDAERLRLQADDGGPFTARRMAAGYRLPF